MNWRDATKKVRNIAPGVVLSKLAYTSTIKGGGVLLVGRGKDGNTVGIGLTNKTDICRVKALCELALINPENIAEILDSPVS